MKEEKEEREEEVFEEEEEEEEEEGVAARPGGRGRENLRESEDKEWDNVGTFPFKGVFNGDVEGDEEASLLLLLLFELLFLKWPI